MVTSTSAEEKKALRKEIRRILSEIEGETLRKSDDALFVRFLALPEVERAQTIFAFWGVPGREPATERLVRELHRRGKTVGLPRMLADRQMEVRVFDPAIPMVQAQFGIWEPSVACPLLSKENIDLALVPSLCYDRNGGRLGFGGGYYDRWLGDFPGLRVGLCREHILRDALPLEEHDLRVDLVVTERECLSNRD